MRRLNCSYYRRREPIHDKAEEAHFHGFFSHAQETGRTLAIALKSGLRAEFGLSLWIDKDELDVGDWLDEKVKRSVQGADVFVLHCADGVFQHRWVRFEFTHAVDALKPILLLEDSSQPFNHSPEVLLAKVPQGYHEALKYLLESHVWMKYDYTGPDRTENLNKIASFLRFPEGVSDPQLREKLRKKLADSWETLEDTELFPALLPWGSNIFEIPFDASRIAQEKADQFEGETRGWMFDDFLRFDQRKESSRALVLYGAAGVGKSCIAAELTRRASGPPKGVYAYPFDVIAIHFFRYDDHYMSDGRLCLFSLANQLGQNLPGYAVMLGGVSNLNWDKLDLATLFRLLIVDPCAHVNKPVKNSWIILDGLDECASRQRNAFIDMLRTNWSKTASWLRLFVTTRDEAGIRRKLRTFEANEIKTDDLRNLQDMEGFLHSRLKRRVLPRELDHVVRRILQLSEGYFLFAYLVDHILKEVGGGVSLDDVTALFPASETIDALDTVFLRYFRRLRDKLLGGSEEDFVKLLAPVVAARGWLPISVGFEIYAANKPKLKLSSFKKLLRDSQLLVIEDNSIHFLHKTMTEWLKREELDESESYSDLQDAGHDLLAKVLAESNGIFAFDHCVYHQACAGTGLTSTVESLSWLGKALLAHKDRNSRLLWLHQLSWDILRAGECATIARVLGLYAEELSKRPEQLPLQLLGRIRDTSSALFAEDPEKSFHPGVSWLKPIQPTLKEPSFGWLRTLSGHQSAVNGVAQDGNTLVSSGADGNVRIWDLDADSTIIDAITLEGHSCVWPSLALDSSIIVAGADGKSVQIWRRADLSEPLSLESTLAVWSVAISSLWIAIGGEDGMIEIWDRSDLMQGGRHQLVGHSGEVTELKFVSSSRLASCSFDGTVRVWEIGEVETTSRVLKGHAACVYGICVEGSTLVSCSEDKSIRIWNLDDLSADPTPLRGHKGKVLAVAISDKTLVSSADDFSLRVWKLDEPDAVPNVIEVASWVASLSLQQNRLIAGCFNGTIQIWDLDLVMQEESETRIWESVGNVRDVDMVDTLIVSCSFNEAALRVFNLDAPSQTPQVIWGHDGNVNAVAISGDLIFSGSEDNTVRVWDLNELEGGAMTIVRGHTTAIISICVLNSGRVVTGSRSGEVFVWDKLDLDSPYLRFQTEQIFRMSSSGEVVSVGTSHGVRVVFPDGEEVKTPRGSNQKRRVAVAVSNDYLLAGDEDCNEVEFWSVDVLNENPGMIGLTNGAYAMEIVGTSLVIADGHIVRVFDASNLNGRSENFHGAVELVQALLFRKGLLLAGSLDEIRVWDFERQDLVHVFGAQNFCEHLISNGEMMAGAFFDGSVRVWRLNDELSLRDAKVLVRHDGRANRVQIYKTKIISCSDDGTIRIADFTNPHWPIVVLSDHTDSVESISVDSGSDLLFSASSDTTIRVWNLKDLRKQSSVVAATDCPILALAANEKWLVVALDDKNLRIWNRHDMKNFTLLPFSTATYFLSLDRDRLAVCDIDAEEVQLFQLSVGTPPMQLLRIYTACYHVFLNGEWLCFTSDNNERVVLRRLIERQDGSINAEVAHDFELGAQTKAITKVGPRVFVSDGEGSLHAFDVIDDN